MAIADFLFDGNAPASQSQFGQSVSGVPTFVSDYYAGLLNKANAVAADPYQAYTGPRVAATNTDQQKAYDLTRQNTGAYNGTLNSAIGTAQGALSQASPYFNAAGANLGAAGDATMAAVAPGSGGLSAAQPYLNQAAGSYTGQTVNAYMNPYTQNVIDQATLAANRNFSEKIMPQLSDTFTSAGQYGSSRHQEEADRAARDLTEGLQTNSAALLSNAYSAGQSAYGADASRYAGLGATAGSLGTQQQSALLSAGQNLGALGQAQGALGTSINSAGVNSASQLGSLAQQGQQMGTADASTLAASGADQQAQAQKNLDTAYGDFTNQKNYSQDQINWLNSLIKGTPYDTSQTQTQTGTSTGGTNTLSNLASLASSAYGISQLFKAQGGLVALKQGGSPPAAPMKHDGRSDTIAARVSPGEWIADAETVSLLGNGDTNAGAQRLEEMRQNLRKHKGKALSRGKFTPAAKRPEQYMGK